MPRALASTESHLGHGEWWKGERLLQLGARPEDEKNMINRQILSLETNIYSFVILMNKSFHHEIFKHTKQWEKFDEARCA